ncbi:MAG: efflux RND transporter periplasmic adaptor subunit [Deltaproteobacteria bacterium]|nr:efflux RND transporter periplasmic adaptor subunit [Deltaproteobacteria bacterium]
MQPAKVIAHLVLLVALASSGCREREVAARLPDRPVVARAPIAAAPARAGAPVPTSPPSEPSGVTGAATGVARGADVAPVLSGTLEPHRRSTLMPKVGGWVVKVHVKEGDVVKRGAALVTVDPAQYKLVLRQAEAGREGAKVGLDAVKLEHDRFNALLAEKAIPQGQFDMIDAKHRGAVVQLRAAEVSLEMARKALRDTTITAPYSGVIVKKHVSEGDNAAAMPPTPLITMEETELLDLRVQVPATDVERVKDGDEVLIHFPSGPPDMKARITRVVPTLNPGTRTFSVIVEIDNRANRLRAGLFAEVRLGARAAAATRAPGARGEASKKGPAKKAGAGR